MVKWVYQKRVDSFPAMTNVAKESGRKLASLFLLEKLPVAAVLRSGNDDAVKFAFSLPDTRYRIESVLLIDGDRRTACLSSQLGCGLGCAFCETGRLGFIRNLTQAEIVGQIIAINDYCAGRADKLVTNVVFMGMGEALANFQNFRSSVGILMDEDCFNIGARRHHGLHRRRGSRPLNGSWPKDRSSAWPFRSTATQTRAGARSCQSTGPIRSRRSWQSRAAGSGKPAAAVTFEYVVIPGETDTPQAVRSLKKYLGGVPSKINCIPLNAVTGGLAASPSRNELVRFAELLHGAGLTATVRTSRGADICGACGQLSAGDGGKRGHPGMMKFFFQKSMSEYSTVSANAHPSRRASALCEGHRGGPRHAPRSAWGRSRWSTLSA